MGGRLSRCGTWARDGKRYCEWTVFRNGVERTQDVVELPEPISNRTDIYRDWHSRLVEVRMTWGSATTAEEKQRGNAKERHGGDNPCPVVRGCGLHSGPEF